MISRSDNHAGDGKGAARVTGLTLLVDGGRYLAQ